MSLLLKKATLVAGSSVPAAPQDVLIENGIVTGIADSISQPADQVLDVAGLQVSPGWVDVFCQFHDTGAEHKETLQSGAAAAAAGGFTDVLVVPNTQPVIHNKAQVGYILQQAAGLPANIIPLGAITKNGEGKELSEMYDMRASGAIAFTDGWRPVQSPQLLLKALQYVKTFGGVVIQLPDEQQLSKNGLINEGLVSTLLGLPGKPALAESLMVARDLELLEYTNSRLHLTGISTRKSIELIRRARERGLDVTCSVTPYHLYFTDEATSGYDTNLKVNPPLRTAADRDALRQAVLDGTIDCISSHHYPQDYDAKVCEFEYAGYGMEGLESSFRVVLSLFPDLPARRIAELFSLNARNIFGLPVPRIEVGQPAHFTLYSATAPATAFEKAAIRSGCTNNAFIGESLPGKVIGTIRGERIFLED